MGAPVTLAAALLFAFNSGPVEPAQKPRQDAKGKAGKRQPAKAVFLCRDIRTKKFARCGLPGTEPVA
jgi:hypothetical protein